MDRTGGIVLAGGASTRMGSSKASLDWHGSTLVRRVAGLLERSVDGPVVVVRTHDQLLPPLPGIVEVARDVEAGLGPVAGLAAGLAALGDRVEQAFVAATDMPWLHPAFVEAMVAALGDVSDVAVPCVRGRRHPLAAVYRTSLLAPVERSLAGGRLRLSSVLDECRVATLGPADLLADPGLAAGDPELFSVENLNTEAEYLDALGRAEPLLTVVEDLDEGGARRAPVRASRLGAAASVVGRSLDCGGAVRLNGRLVASDPELPLATGDEVVFR